MHTATPRETYAEWLSRQMRERNLSQRGLARAMRPGDPETARRALKRYLNGMVPQERTRIDIARALGTDETGPSESSDDDEEGSLLADLQRLIAAAQKRAEQIEALRLEHDDQAAVA